MAAYSNTRSVVKTSRVGYEPDMRFRMGMVTGFAAGYYMGTKAGRQRYDQINRAVSKLRKSDALEEAVDKAKAVVEDGVEKARTMVDARSENGQNGLDGDRLGDSGLIVPGQPGPLI